jgi:sugar/nucleoside kinase (ribokinase family)
MREIDVYGIGNPLIDVLIPAEDSELAELKLAKGTMHLIDLDQRKQLLDFFNNREHSYSCGGSAPNTIIALASLGIPSAIGGKIGADEFGTIYEKQLQEHPLQAALIRGSGSTGSSIILVSPDSERTMNTYLGVNRDFGPEDIDEHFLDNAGNFYFTGYMWDTDSQKEASKKCITLAKKTDTRIIFDVADPFAVNRNRAEFINLIQNDIDVVFANKEEAKILFEVDDPREAVEHMSEYCEVAVVKNGGDGSFVKPKAGKTIHIPVIDVKPIDTTGAGDIYAAGFIYGLVKNMDLVDCGKIGTYLAGHLITQRGAQLSPFMRKKLALDVESMSWRAKFQ